MPKKRKLFGNKGIAKTFHKKKKIFAIAATGIVLLAIIAVLYTVSPESGSNQETIIVKFVDTVYDQLNPLRTPAPKNEFVTEYDFELSAADLEYFKDASLDSIEAGYRTEFASDYRKVKMKHEGESYNVRMALLGDKSSHFIWNKKSFKIKADNEEFIENKKRINFVLPLERQYIELPFSKYVANKVGLFTPEYEIALIKFNGEPIGLYIVSENWDEYFLEKNQEPGTVILKRSENFLQDHAHDDGPGVTFGQGHITPFDLEVSNFEEIDSEFESEIMYKVMQMLEAVETNNQNKFENIFDIEQVAKVEAYIAIFGQGHDFEGDNTRFFYNTTTGKFGLVPRSEGGIESVIDEGFQGTERSLSTSGNKPELTTRYILRNTVLRNKRNEILWKLLQDKDEIFDYFEELEQKYMPLFLMDSTDSVRSSKAAYWIKQDKKNLKQNMEILEKQFNYNKAYISIIENGNAIAIEIIPDSTSAIKFNKFNLILNKNTKAKVTVFDEKENKIAEKTIESENNKMQLQELINKNILHADLDEEMQPKVTTFKYTIEFPNSAGVEINNVEINSVEIEAQNAITGKVLQEDEIYITIAKDNESEQATAEDNEGEF